MQADTLAGLLRTLDLAPAVVMGGSGGSRSLAPHRGSPPGRHGRARAGLDLGWRLRAPAPRGPLLRRVGPRGVAGRHGGRRRAARVGRSPRAEPAEPRSIPHARAAPVHRDARTVDARLLPGTRLHGSRSAQRRAREARRADAHLPQRRERPAPHARDVGDAARADPGLAPRRATVARRRVEATARPPAPAPATSSNTGRGSLPSSSSSLGTAAERQGWLAASFAACQSVSSFPKFAGL